MSLKAAVCVEGGAFGKTEKYGEVVQFQLSAMKNKLQGPGGSSLVFQHEDFKVFELCVITTSWAELY